jgi:hypothetical protein
MMDAYSCRRPGGGGIFDASSGTLFGALDVRLRHAKNTPTMIATSRTKMLTPTPAAIATVLVSATNGADEEDEAVNVFDESADESVVTAVEMASVTMVEDSAVGDVAPELLVDVVNVLGVDVGGRVVGVNCGGCVVDDGDLVVGGDVDEQFNADCCSCEHLQEVMGIEQFFATTQSQRQANNASVGSN